MSNASIVMRDTDDGSVHMEVVFDGQFDQASQAHAGIRKILEIIDGMGIEIQEPPAAVDAAPGAKCDG